MNNESIETYQRNNLTVKIFYDNSDPESPLNWTTPDERKVTFALHHKRYTLPFELDNAQDFEEYASWTELAKSNAPSNQPNFRFVRWYEHSGISVSLRDDEGGQDWDAGIAGVIFGETTEDINQEFATWKQYIEGDIYEYIIEDKHGEMLDACGNIYGFEFAKESANEVADAYRIPRRSNPARMFHS